MRAYLALPLVLLSALTTLTLANPLSALDPRAPAQCLQCKPFPTPGDNSQQCDQSTICVTQGGRNYCACRGGYRGSGAYPPGDTSVQYRLSTPGQEGRVFVSPGVQCNTLCNEWYLGKDGCKEVGLRADC